MPAKKAKPAGPSFDGITISGCTFSSGPTRDLVEAVIAIAEAAEENARAIGLAARALLESVPSAPMLSIGGQ